EFGSSVALSSDGSTAVIGGAADNSGTGAAWVFKRSGLTWKQQGAKLTGAAENLGTSVALSADGNTVLIGAPYCKGGGWVFTRSGSAWTQQAALRFYEGICPDPDSFRNFG